MHLLAEAAYTPNSELTLPHNKTRELLHASDTAITKAKGDLAAAGIMILVSPGIAPNRMGGQSNAGRAAVFALPHRKSGCLPNECLWGRDGGPAREGYWRIHCDYLRWLIENLSAHALRVFVFLHATNHTEAGMVADISGRAINHNEVGLTKPTCARAICELLDRDILEFERRPAGRRAATYRLCVKARGGIRKIS